MNDQVLIENLKKDVKSLDIIYTKHKTYCLNLMKKYHNDSDAIKDIYQDAIIVLYEKVISDNFKLSSTIQTYLNSICINQVIKRFKKDANNIEISEEITPNLNEWFDDQRKDQNDNELKSIEKALEKLKKAGGNCYEILQRFFYKKQSLQEIAIQMDYKYDNLKTQKSKCQKRLKDLSQSFLKTFSNE
jgi:RNA polymerase sigma factor (sigma-70 family)